MIKGINKNMVVVKNTGSRYFEEAHFILRSGISQRGEENEFLNEARRIVSSVLIEQGKQSGKKRRVLHIILPVLAFAAGVGIGIFAALLF